MYLLYVVYTNQSNPSFCQGYKRPARRGSELSCDALRTAGSCACASRRVYNKAFVCYQNPKRRVPANQPAGRKPNQTKPWTTLDSRWHLKGYNL